MAPSPQDDLNRLLDVLRALDPVQARSIFDAVDQGTMDIAEATVFVEQFLATLNGSPPAPHEGGNTGVRHRNSEDLRVDVRPEGVNAAEDRGNAGHDDAAIEGAATGMLSLHVSISSTDGLVLAIDTLYVFDGIVSVHVQNPMSSCMCGNTWWNSAALRCIL